MNTSSTPTAKSLGPGLPDLRPKVPGLFVTGTDTGVGKTVVTCAIALALRRQNPGLRVGALKPLASGCRREREGLVNEDAEALAHFSDGLLPLDVVNPLRFRLPLAPASAAQREGRPPDWGRLQHAVRQLAEHHEVLLVEGVGGLRVPLDPRDPALTVVELMQAVGLPTVIVARAGLGTLNHTVMTAEILRGAGLSVAGIVINGQPTDVQAESEDPSLSDNARWMTAMTGLPVLATLPEAQPGGADVHRGELDDAIAAAAEQVDWRALMAKPPA